MNPFKQVDLRQALNMLLDREREALLTGQIETLSALALDKERLFQKLPTATLSRLALDELRNKADQNQALLVAASKGIRTVSRRLDVLRKQKSQLKTYSAEGQRQDLAKPKSTFEKRS